jgi:site-specific recombinase XerD
LSWLKQRFSVSEFKLPVYAYKDYQHVLNFLYSYRGSLDTFNSYRRELERLIQWCWLIHEESILKLKRNDIEAFIEFCQSPNKRWIGIKTAARFREG